VRFARDFLPAELMNLTQRQKATMHPRNHQSSLISCPTHSLGMLHVNNPHRPDQTSNQ
jgi:hypothetical protein